MDRYSIAARGRVTAAEQQLAQAYLALGRAWEQARGQEQRVTDCQHQVIRCEQWLAYCEKWLACCEDYQERRRTYAAFV